MASSSKSLEEMLASDVDETAFSALVGTLETQLDTQMTNQVNASGHNTTVNANCVNKSLTDHNLSNANSNSNNNNNNNNCSNSNQESSIINNNNINSNSISNSNNNNSSTTISSTSNTSNLLNSSTTTTSSSSTSNNNQQTISVTVNNNNNINEKRIPININNIVINNNNSDISKCSIISGTTTSVSSSSTSSSSSSNILSSNLPGALPASGYINQVTNSPSTPVASAMPANQILQNAIKVSAMSNGNGSPTIIQQAPQQQAPQPQQLTQNTSIPQNRPATTIALSAIQSSLLLGQNKTVGAKPGQTVYIATTKDGPVLVQPTSGQQHITSCDTGTVGINTNNTSSNSQLSTNVTGPTSGVLAIAKTTIVTNSNPSVTNATAVSGQGQNIVHHVVSNPNQQILQLVNVNPSRPTGNATNIQTQKTLAPRVVQLPSNVRLTPQVIRPGGPVQGTITLPSNLLRAGTILVKSENGQVHMVNVGAQITPTSTSGQPGSLPTTYRFQVPTAGPNQAPGVRNLAPQHQLVLPVSMTNATLQQNKSQVPQTQVQVQPTQPLTIQTTAANAQAAATPSQMSPNTAKKKCKNFLSTLIRLASDQPEQVATNVKNLIQGLIDDAIQPEDFTNQLQKELNSSPQPCLVPFLKKSLPYLRYSLMQRELTIEGVRPPPQGAVSLPQPQAIPQIQIAQTTKPGFAPTVRLLTPIPGGLTLPVGAQGAVITPITHTTAQRLPTTPQVVNKSFTPSTSSMSSTKPLAKTTAKSRSPAASKEKSKFSSSLRDDDDINDVAAMGGVNLLEESQRILASNSEIVGQQIRSCKDENFLFTTPLSTKINKIASKFGLDEVSTDVVSLVSHAVQERLKSLVEKLGIIAEHRQEQLKNDPKYEVYQDVKAQVQFLQELDRLEKRKHEEQEREVLMRAAKSRSKAEDPEQIRLKQRAKELQRQELEELRQKEANETALQAIGNPRKKFKHTINSTSLNNTQGGSNINCTFNSSLFSNSTSKPMKRVKRVCMRDLHFLMENDRDTIRSITLYKAYAK